ncbi:MAG: peptidylprolyl isomerase [Opitutales bacterium]
MRFLQTTLFAVVFAACAPILAAQQIPQLPQPQQQPAPIPQEQDPALQRLGNGIAAVVEGEIITVEELRREIQPILPRIRSEASNQSEFNQRLDQLSEEILQNMIDRIIVVKAAEKEGISIPDSYIDQEYKEIIANDFDGDRQRFLEYLKSRGETPKEFRENVYRRIVVGAMRQRNRRSESEISPKRIEDFYVKNKIRFYQEEAMHLRQIILSPMADEEMDLLHQTANKIISDLEKGAHFGDLAREHSQDEKSREGGDWGWINRADIREELSEVAFSLEPGEHSKPVEIDETIFILYCEAIREEEIQPISKVREVIEERLLGDIARKNQQEWLRKLRDDAYVQTFL